MLRTPVNPQMDRNNFVFSHDNGTVRATVYAKLD